ncbi:MAG TPA: sigma-70 family RNA polymerase sigma factor [Acidisoma sp.]|uniref:sigma-70 family RNA polymerase sigma factor n=1 Tax=Acidisoma sp. TaxID=1872115 RepID=UPI002CE02614|nr:sigma-70 family RNA polymerase sigma factor [Acidisoma sp.]HTI00215.1 sigma-70 family RNA polymerase sigma factor [Acidisoma sp.]
MMAEQMPLLPDDAALRKLYGNWVKRTALMLKARMPWADLDELLQLGAVGMLEALQRFDSTRGIDFQAFCARRIRGAMIDGLRREGAIHRGETVFDTEVVETAAVKSGDSPEDPLHHLSRADDKKLIAAALRTLPALEYRVLALHFYDDMNNREIAAILNISEGYASRIRKRALEQLAARLTAVTNGVTASCR